MNYYKLDNILAEEEKLKVKLPCNVDSFGFYTNPSLKAIKSNTKAELPFFLIKFLLQNGFCHLIENPFESVKNDLEAQASLVDLRNTHFFSINKYISDPQRLSEIFYERIGVFISLMIKEDFTEEDLVKMSYEEKRLIINSRMAFKEFYQVNSE